MPLCWCLGGTMAPPEISVVTKSSPMKSVPVPPRPADEKILNGMFEELVAELGLDQVRREEMLKLPPDKKWQIYCGKMKEERDTAKGEGPEFYIENIKLLANVCGDSDEMNRLTETIQSLKTALRTQPMSFVMRFIDLNGLQCLLDFLTVMDHSTRQTSTHSAVIGCIKALMNNQEGRAHVLGHPHSVRTIAQSAHCTNYKTKVAALEILGAMCLIPGGHKKVLEAMTHYQSHAGERTRFQHLICDLETSHVEYKDEVSVKTAILSFINAALSYGAGEGHLEFRLHLRYELLMLGIQPIIDKLRSLENATLDRHLDFFEIVRANDERELACKFETIHIDTKSASAMFDHLKQKLTYTTSYSHFLSLLQHLLTVPLRPDGEGMWQLINYVVQQICIQQADAHDPDVCVTKMDVKHLVKQITMQNEMKMAQDRLEAATKATNELRSKLSQKDRECAAKSREKDELVSTLSVVKLRLDKESIQHSQTKDTLKEVMEELRFLESKCEQERSEREKLQQMITCGSLPDDAKIDFSISRHSSMERISSTKSFLNDEPQAHSFAKTSTPGLPPPPPPVLTTLGAPPPPPPPPPNGKIPAAPPPPRIGLAPSRMDSVPDIKKNIPQPSQPLKSFNWAKLPNSKISGTVWDDLDDTKLYKKLDLDEFERNFSAYQKKSAVIEEEEIRSSKNQKVKELSLIDGRRAQNCTILLSKLRLSNREIVTAVMSMDKQEELAKDMLEQLLKYIPSPEETQMLNEHSAVVEEMARADHFLLTVSKIVHYEQRLRALFFKKKFNDRIAEVKPRIEAVMSGSSDVIRSKKLRRILEIVLAFGNYMNRGQRGNASGFKLSSLNKIVDTKSSIDKKVTLLNYLIETIMRTFPEVSGLDMELTNTRHAAKVNFKDVGNEITSLRKGIQDIEKELDFHRTTSHRHDDLFVSVMNDFITVATYQLSDIEDQHLETSAKYQRALKLFGEEPSTSPEDFFSIFSLFLSSFGEARVEYDTRQKKLMEEEKRKRAEEEIEKKKQKQSKKYVIASPLVHKTKTEGKDLNDSGEFDDLISALRTGDMFRDDLANLKRNRKRVQRVELTRERGGVSDI